MVDFDADGDLDLLLASARNLWYFEFQPATDAYTLAGGVGVNDKAYEEQPQLLNPLQDIILTQETDGNDDLKSYPYTAFADMDDDGDQDLLIGTKNGVIYYINEGTPSAPKFVKGPEDFFPWLGCSFCTIALGDVNGDGKIDAVVSTSTDVAEGVLELLYFQNTGPNSTNPKFEATPDANNPFADINSAAADYRLGVIGTTLSDAEGTFTMQTPFTTLIEPAVSIVGANYIVTQANTNAQGVVKYYFRNSADLFVLVVSPDSGSTFNNYDDLTITNDGGSSETKSLKTTDALRINSHIRQIEVVAPISVVKSGRPKLTPRLYDCDKDGLVDLIVGKMDSGHDTDMTLDISWYKNVAGAFDIS